MPCLAAWIVAVALSRREEETRRVYESIRCGERDGEWQVSAVQFNGLDAVRRGGLGIMRPITEEMKYLYSTLGLQVLDGIRWIIYLVMVISRWYIRDGRRLRCDCWQVESINWAILNEPGERAYRVLEKL